MHLIDIVVEPIILSLSNYVVEACSRGLVVTKDQVGVEKGNAYVAKATQVGLEVENEGTKVATPQEIDHDAKEGGEATNVVHDEGPPQGKGDDHGLEFTNQYSIDLALPWDAQPN